MRKYIEKNIFGIVAGVISILIFMPFLVGHMATDTYYINNVGLKNYAIEYSLNDGRIFMALLGNLMQNFNIKIVVILTLFMAIIVSAVCVYKLCKIISEYKQPKSKFQKIILFLISYVTIFNFMYIENLYFIESFVMAISLLLFIIASDKLVKKEKNWTIKTVSLVILATMFYQGTICMFFILTFTISLLKNKNNIKSIMLDLIECGVIALIAMVLNIVLVKIIGEIFGMEQERLNSISQIPNNLIKIIKFTYVILLLTCGLYYKYLYVLISVALLLLIVCKFNNDKKGNSLIIKLVSIFIIGVIASSLIFILSNTSFVTGRLRLSIGATIGLMFAIIFVETDAFEGKKIFDNLIKILLVVYFITIISSYLYLITVHKIVNKDEQEQVQEINEYIENYEKETGNKVENIVKIKIKNQEERAYSQKTKNMSMFTYIATKSNLAAEGVIYFYTGRKLQVQEIPKDEQQQVLEEMKKRSDVENENQKNIEKDDKTIENNSKRDYICIGNTFYTLVYMF